MYNLCAQISSLDITEGSICASVSFDNDSNVTVWLTDGEDKLVSVPEFFINQILRIKEAIFFRSLSRNMSARCTNVDGFLVVK